MKAKLNTVLALMTILIMLLAACGPGQPAETQPPAEPAETMAPEETEPMEPAPTDTQAAEPTEAPTEAAEEQVGEAYKIGFAAAITGPGSSLGIPERNTAELIAQQLNDQGGVTGPDGVQHEVEIVIFDTESNPDTAASVVRRLIEEENVQVLVAGTLSGNSLAMVPLATEAEVPLISMASARSIIEDPETGETRTWIFKTPQENLHSARWQADYLSTLELTQVCHLFENTGYGQDTFNSAQSAFDEAGVEIVFSGSFERTDTEFPQVIEAQASGCEAVVIGAIPPGASNSTIAVRDAMPDTPIIHGHGTCNQAFIDLAGEAAEGVVSPCGRIWVAETLPDDDPQKDLLLTYIENYEAMFGERPDTFGGHAWDALHWAIEGLGSLEAGMDLDAQRTAIRDYVETNIKDWPGTGGVFTITPDDHLGLDFQALTFVRVEDGQWVFFPPEEWQ